MKFKESISIKAPIVTLVLALVLFMFSLLGSHPNDSMEITAERLEHRIAQRTDILNGYIQRALDTETDKLILIEELPKDMVIYRYVNDSLQSWCHQFPTLNDDISSRLVFQKLTDFRNRLTSPLSKSREEISYTNIGPKWYLIKSVTGENNERIIAGLEIKNTLIDDLHTNENGVNPLLKLPRKYSVIPLSHSGGCEVRLNGIPMFKVIHDSNKERAIFDNTQMRWISLLLLAVATIMFLMRHRTFRTFCASCAALTFIFFISYIWGMQMNGSYTLFSPNIYADGGFFFSLGVLLLMNIYLALINVCIYLVRKSTFVHLQRRCRNSGKALALIAVLKTIGIAAIIAYCAFTINSLIRNSSITLELYRWNSNFLLTGVVYLSYLSVLFGIVLKIQETCAAYNSHDGKTRDVFSLKALTLFAIVFSLFLSIESGILGFAKEQDRIMVWANRMAVERDLGMEIQLKGVEEEIANDQLIAALTEIDNSGDMIASRISEYYLGRLRQSCDIDVAVIKENDRRTAARFSELLRTGTPITNDSRFMFIKDANGSRGYAGIFAFYNPQSGLKRVLLTITPNSHEDSGGYHHILGRFSSPGSVSIPQHYSHARYAGGRLLSYHGNYPYPTVPEPLTGGNMGENSEDVTRQNGYVHFIKQISEDELIVISRPKRATMVYFTAFSYLALGIAALFILVTRRRRHKDSYRSTFFRNRINTILFVSSSVILISLTAISILFVYQRNEVNMHNLMSSKISTIQALIQNRIKHVESYTELANADFMTTIDNISQTTKSDITLYTPAGKVFHSTTPEIFDKLIMGSRISQDAFHQIKDLKQHFHIQQEEVAGFKYWSLYAPVMNGDGDVIALVGTPYTDRSFDFRREAFFHAAVIVNIFLLLLIVSLLFSTRQVNELISPLEEMGAKMNRMNIDNFERIRYNREDEVSTLVDAYNQMVQDLALSTRKLAQAERDKAWSQMARQVAHEIKNPLTPIKLEIQRLIRMKQNGNPRWEEKFEQVSQVILEHIDILTETANEFSTFAKLYSEDPVVLDLDKTLKDQLMIFDNKENIHIEYIGMSGAMVSAPRPQLIRVFVNLITNAIQAIEIMQKEALENDEGPVPGKIRISLRYSTREGFYDIVFDDNGPGVSEENQGRLFTPNFTTKSSGTGLGLAICRNIIEKCDGEIGYRRSYALGGASFIVTIPKHQA